MAFSTAHFSSFVPTPHPSLLTPHPLHLQVSLTPLPIHLAPNSDLRQIDDINQSISYFILFFLSTDILSLVIIFFLFLSVKWQLWRKLELGALHTIIFYHYKSINTRERKKIKHVMAINYSYTPPQNRVLLFFTALSSLIYLFLIYCSWVSKYPSIWILTHSQPKYSKIAQFCNCTSCRNVVTVPLLSSRIPVFLFDSVKPMTTTIIILMIIASFVFFLWP